MLNKLWTHFKYRVLLDNRGIFGAIAAGLSAAAAIKSLTSKKGGSNLEGFEIPEFFEDPKFKESQDFLFGTGKDILGGEIPDFFKAIGSPGSDELEDIISLTNRDILKGTAEASARAGRGRGGNAAQVASRAIADNTKQLRFSDFLRATKGKEFLFNQGRGITENVSSRALANQGQRNQFNLNASRLELGKLTGLDEIELLEGELAGNTVGNFFDIASTANENGSFDFIKDKIFGKDEKLKTPSIVDTKNIVSSLGRIKGTSGIELENILSQLI